MKIRADGRNERDNYSQQPGVRRSRPHRTSGAADHRTRSASFWQSIDMNITHIRTHGKLKAGCGFRYMNLEWAMLCERKATMRTVRRIVAILLRILGMGVRIIRNICKKFVSSGRCDFALEPRLDVRFASCFTTTITQKIPKQFLLRKFMTWLLPVWTLFYSLTVRRELKPTALT